MKKQFLALPFMFSLLGCAPEGAEGPTSVETIDTSSQSLIAADACNRDPLPNTASHCLEGNGKITFYVKTSVQQDIEVMLYVRKTSQVGLTAATGVNVTSDDSNIRSSGVPVAGGYLYSKTIAGFSGRDLVEYRANWANPAVVSGVSLSGYPLNPGERAVHQVLAPGYAIQSLPGCFQNTLPPSDDGSSEVPLNFPSMFVDGAHQTKLFVNNNGNVTFGYADGAWYNYPLNYGRARIAPFWGDVDTRPDASAKVSYGYLNYGGRPALCVNWTGVGNGVGSFNLNTAQLNSFQLIVVERGDSAQGDFDFIFNYGQIQWESGSAAYTNYARAGYLLTSSNSASGPGQWGELAGSGTSGALLDSSPNGLIFGSNHLPSGSEVPGRSYFQVRSGVVINATP